MRPPTAPWVLACRQHNARVKHTSIRAPGAPDAG